MGINIISVMFILTVVLLLSNTIAIYIRYKKKRIENEEIIKQLNDQVINSELRANLFKNDIGKLSKYLNKTNYVSSELRKREILEIEIEKLKRVIDDTKTIAQDASMVKSDFLTNVRHEIRTPMNSILVFAEILEKEVDDKKLSEYAINIRNSGYDLLSLLNNIIELSEIESGSFNIKKSGIDVKDFFYSIIELHKSEANKKDLKLSIDINDNMPDSIVIDQVRVKEILNNLIENSIKFTEQGEVKILLYQKSFDKLKNEADISISVEDTGIGISKENQNRIFKIFESRESNNEIEYQGTGLGLSINRKLASLMNGDLKVKSELLKGSKFILTLRGVEVILHSFKTDETDVNIDFGVIDTEGSVVVIDDDEFTFDIVKDSFSETDRDIIYFKRTSDAIEVLKSKEVKMIIINIEILTMDDGVVSKIINSISDATVVALVNDRLQSIDFHEDGVNPIFHLKKPVNKVELFRVALKVFNSENVIYDDEILDFDVSEELRQEICFECDEDKSKAYFSAQSIEMKELLENSINSKDLNSIGEFAKILLELSTEHQIDSLVSFAKELNEKIDVFDIEAIDRMIYEYKEAAEKFEER